MAATWFTPLRRYFPGPGRLPRARRAGTAASPVAYFDGPGGTQVPLAVADAVSDYLLHHNANTHWHYPTSHETDAIIARRPGGGGRPPRRSRGRGGVRRQHDDPDVPPRAGARAALGPGRRDRGYRARPPRQRGPWRALGARIEASRCGPYRSTARAASWTGTRSTRRSQPRPGWSPSARPPMRSERSTTWPAPARLARAAGALLFVDAVHYTPHLLPDVQAFGADFLAARRTSSTARTSACSGAGASCSRELDVPKLEPAPDAAPERIETGTLSHEGIAGTLAAVDFLAGLVGPEPAEAGRNRRERLAIVYAQLHARASASFARFWNGLAAIPGLRSTGPRPAARGRPPCRSRSRGGPRMTSPRPWPTRRCSSRAVTSTRRRW